MEEFKRHIMNDYNLTEDFADVIYNTHYVKK